MGWSGESVVASKRRMHGTENTELSGHTKRKEEGGSMLFIVYTS